MSWSAVGRKARQGLQEDDFRTQPVPDRTQFETDDPGPDDAQSLWNLIEVQRAFVINNVLVVKFHIRNGNRNRSGSEYDVFTFQFMRITRFNLGDGDFAVGTQRAGSVESK